MNRAEIFQAITSGKLVACRHRYLVVTEDGPPTCKRCGKPVPEVNVDKQEAITELGAQPPSTKETDHV